MTKPKPKPKRKDRQWKLKGWVAVANEDLDSLHTNDLGNACRYCLCGSTKHKLFRIMRDEGISRKTHTPLELDIEVIER